MYTEKAIRGRGSRIGRGLAESAGVLFFIYYYLFLMHIFAVLGRKS